jgi:hypothetical protein
MTDLAIIYSEFLFVMAFTDSKDWIYAAFIVSGTGITVMFPLSAFGNPCLDVKRKPINNEIPFDKF